MEKIKEKLLFILIGAAALAADQVSKACIQSLMASRGDSEIFLIRGFLSIIHSFNTGIAFGMFKGLPSFYLYLPILLIVVMLAIFLRLGRGRTVSLIGLGMMLGGALGNLVDRIRLGRVFDFIDVYVGNAHWPTFNAADAFIVIGVFLFAIAMLRGERNA